MTALLSIRDLCVEYRTRVRGKRTAVRVIDSMNLDVEAGETLAIVGESGSGKSTLAATILGLVPPVSGSITYDGTELVGIGRADRRAVQRDIQLVFQNPLLSLSPRRRVATQLDEPLTVHTSMNRTERHERIAHLLAELELSPATLERFPHELSGGQAQRVVLARALTLHPKVIVFDEPTSALDVSVQAGVLNLLQRIKADEGLTYVFITHDLGVARHLADRIAVMQRGEIVELAETADLFDSPDHPYTRALLASSLTV